MPTSSKPPRASVRRRLALCGISLALGLVLTDLAVGHYWIAAGRYAGPPLPPFGVQDNPSLLSWVEAQRALPPAAVARRACGVFDHELGWTNREGRTARDGQQVTINSLGARSEHEYSEAASEGTLRLACFGDSFTFGSEVNDAETWSAQLESSEERLEVLNFGVAGYGLDQALLRFRRVRERVDADVLVIGLQVDAIGRNVNRCRPLLATRSQQVFVKPRFKSIDSELQLVPLPFADRMEFLECAARGELLQALADEEFWTRDAPLLPCSSLLRILKAQQAFGQRHKHRLWRMQQGEPFGLALELLEQFRAEALAGGVRAVVLVLFPDSQDFEIRTPQGSPYLEPLRAALRKGEWSWIDLDVQLAPQLADPSELFVTAHFNARGNARVAQALHSWLLSRSDLLD